MTTFGVQQRRLQHGIEHNTALQTERKYTAVETNGRSRYQSTSRQVGCSLQDCRATKQGHMHRSISGSMLHSIAQSTPAQASTTQHSTTQHSTAQHSTAQHSTAQHSTAQHSMTQADLEHKKPTVPHSTACTDHVQHRKSEHITAQLIAAQRDAGRT